MPVSDQSQHQKKSNKGILTAFIAEFFREDREAREKQKMVEEEAYAKKAKELMNRRHQHE